MPTNPDPALSALEQERDALSDRISAAEDELPAAFATDAEHDLADCICALAEYASGLRAAQGRCQSERDRAIGAAAALSAFRAACAQLVALEAKLTGPRAICSYCNATHRANSTCPVALARAALDAYPEPRTDA